MAWSATNRCLNKEQAAFFVLLRAGLWESEPEDLSLFPLTADGWQQLFRLARQQTVTGMVYEGLCRLPDALLPPERLLLQWVVEVDAVENRNRRMNTVLARLYALFGSRGLTPVLLKGQGVAGFYANPLRRDCGDIDFYFPVPGEGEQAVSLISGMGHTVTRQADDSWCYRWENIEVEHHARLLDISNPVAGDYLKRMEEKWGFCAFGLTVGGEKVSIKTPAPLLNLLLINTHILKHALGRGIGLRQLCDMARACHALHADVEGDEVVRVVRKLGIDRWNRLLHAFMVDYMGVLPEWLPVKDRAYSAAPLLHIVLRGGNFGQYAEGRDNPSCPVWRRKLDTSLSFLGNARFACGHAPVEAFWTFVGLLAGQRKQVRKTE